MPTGLIAHQVAEIGLGIGFTAKVNAEAQLPKSRANHRFPLTFDPSFGLPFLGQRQLVCFQNRHQPGRHRRQACERRIRYKSRFLEVGQVRDVECEVSHNRIECNIAQLLNADVHTQLTNDSPLLSERRCLLPDIGGTGFPSDDKTDNAVLVEVNGLDHRSFGSVRLAITRD